jgi:hypothetical protein
MKSTELQKIVKKIFGDEETKQQFIVNPDVVLARFALTEQEKRAMLNIHAKTGLVTSNTQQLEAALNPTMDWSAPTP